jgi:hypothetical protein
MLDANSVFASLILAADFFADPAPTLILLMLQLISGTVSWRLSSWIEHVERINKVFSQQWILESCLIFAEIFGKPRGHGDVPNRKSKLHIWIVEARLMTSLQNSHNLHVAILESRLCHVEGG